MNEQLCQIWRRCAPPFFCYLRKTDGGAHMCPPGRARVNHHEKFQTDESIFYPKSSQRSLGELGIGRISANQERGKQEASGPQPQHPEKPAPWKPCTLNIVGRGAVVSWRTRRRRQRRHSALDGAFLGEVRPLPSGTCETSCGQWHWPPTADRRPANCDVMAARSGSAGHGRMDAGFDRLRRQTGTATLPRRARRPNGLRCRFCSADKLHQISTYIHTAVATSNKI